MPSHQPRFLRAADRASVSALTSSGVHCGLRVQRYLETCFTLLLRHRSRSLDKGPPGGL